jgi:hypothetical protein
MARADWLARSIGEFIAKIDRSSGRDHEKLVSLLVNHELALRSAERGDRRGDPAAPRTDKRGSEPGSERIRAARAATAESTRRAGLEADLESAHGYLGESPDDLTGPLVGVPEATVPDRVRHLGRPAALVGVLPGINEPSPAASLTLESRPWEASAAHPPVRVIVVLLLLFGIALATALTRLRFFTDVLAPLLALVLAGFVAGPMALVGGLGLVAVGWSKARR